MRAVKIIIFEMVMMAADELHTFCSYNLNGLIGNWCILILGALFEFLKLYWFGPPANNNDLLFNAGLLSIRTLSNEGKNSPTSNACKTLKRTLERTSNFEILSFESSVIVWENILVEDLRNRHHARLLVMTVNRQYRKVTNSLQTKLRVMKGYENE